MRKSLVVLAILSTMSVPAVADVPTTNSTDAQAKPQTVKKRVCEFAEEDSYSRLGGRKICHTVEVQVKPEQNAAAQQTPAQAQPQPQGR